MTNREWLNSLSNEDFVMWLTAERSCFYVLEPHNCLLRYGERLRYKKVWKDPVKPYTPTKYEVTRGWANANDRLREWLKEEREEIGSEET